MNLYLYGFGKGKNRRWIMVDCGVTFGDMASSPGIDIVMPDIDFIAAERKKLVGIFITHAHEDHVGALGRLWRRLKAPIYCTKFTAEIARNKLGEAGIGGKEVKTVEPHTPIEVGPFTCRYFPITHSIPGAMSLIIDTPAGRVFHTGDFKLDPEPLIGPPVDEAALADIGKEGVLALACDSTNVLMEGHAGSEGALKEGLERVMRDCEGAVAATTFASNVARLRTIAEIGRKLGRSIVIAGRAMNRMIDTAVETGAIPDFPDTISDEQAAQLPSENLLYLLTGSQGEGRAALARVATGSHPFVSLGEGDMVIYSSRTIPGNEVEVYRIHNKLSALGVRVVDADDDQIHTSGHGRSEDIKRLYELLKPQISLPLHGEHRHLRHHAKRALEWGAEAAAVATNGTMLQLSPPVNGEAPVVVEEIETGRTYLDGETFVGALDGVVRARLKLARQGHVSIALVLDEEGVLIADPEVRCLGAPEDGEGWPAPLEEMIMDAVDEAIDRLSDKDRLSDAQIEETATVACRRVCAKHWGKRPEVTAMAIRLDEED
ncbi:MAG: ribonuclease J [Neomegalonema sp.]|nr:ribonuclease J [Neomegalonema sp.]